MCPLLLCFLCFFFRVLFFFCVEIFEWFGFSDKKLLLLALSLKAKVVQHSLLCLSANSIVVLVVVVVLRKTDKLNLI